MELRQLRYFITVAETGSFTGAAAVLGVLQPTVSQHIQRLEGQLNTNLFERHARGVRLTYAGRHLLRSARRIVRELDAALDHATRAARAQAGILRLGFFTSLSAGLMREMLASFRRATSGIEIELCETSPSDLLAAVREHRLDLALTVLGGVPAEFATQRLWDEELVAAMPKGHPLASRGTVSWSDLLSTQLIVRAWESGSPIYTFLVGRIARDSLLPVEQHFVSREALLGLVGLGFGITVMGVSAAGAQFPGVVFKPINEPDASVPVTAVWLPENDNPLRGRFVAQARDWRRQRSR